MNIVIVEDEYMVAKRLKRFVQQCFAEGLTDSESQIPIKINVFDSLSEANDYLSEVSIDLLFLDLNLHGQDGFELLKLQVSKSFHTIVVSANTERAIEAFDIGVLDFIAKPFSYERIKKALKRLSMADTRGQSQFLSYKKIGELVLLPIAEINYIKASGHYSEITTISGDSVLHDKNLDKLSQVLPSHFERIHRSYLVSMKAVVSISSEEGSKYWLTLNNGEDLPIGRTRVKALKNKLI